MLILSQRLHSVSGSSRHTPGQYSTPLNIRVSFPPLALVPKRTVFLWSSPRTTCVMLIIGDCLHGFITRELRSISSTILTRPRSMSGLALSPSPLSSSSTKIPFLTLRRPLLPITVRMVLIRSLTMPLTIAFRERYSACSDSLAPLP